MSKLVDQIKEALAVFGRLRTSPALIGGLALASHRVVRATRDIDDIRALLIANANTLDMAEVRRYFALFEREELLESLLAQA